MTRRAWFAWLLFAALLARPIVRAEDEVAPSDDGAAETPAAPEAGAAETPADEGTEHSGDVELMGEGGEEEEAAPDEPAKPKPKRKPRPRPAPKPRKPASPFDYRMIEDFEKAAAGAEPGALRRAGTDPKPQFSVKAGPGGFESANALTLTGVPAMADATVWVLTPAAPLGLAGWRGISVRARSTAPTVELKIGVAGGGSVYGSAVLGTDWSEVRFDFARATGQGRFDPGSVRAIVLTVSHELNQPVDVTVDSIAAWRERVPSEALRLGLNVSPVAGPADWRAVVEAVNCAPRASAQEGLALGFWSAPLPYLHWPSTVEFRDLPRGLAGATGLVAQVKVEPASPPVLLKFTLIEERGERFMAVRAVPEDGSALKLPLAAFAPDALANLRTPAAEADGRLNPAAVTGWSLTVLPSTERQFKGTVFLQDFWAEGAERPRPAPAPRPVARPKPAASAPEPAAEPSGDEEPAGEEPAGDGAIEMEQ